MRVLKENWLWIVAPIALFAAAALYLYYSGDGGSLSGDGVYNTY
ncbi:MAG: hypothetical protein AAGG01_04105 [Planctomycetota bacterium]